MWHLFKVNILPKKFIFLVLLSLLSSSLVLPHGDTDSNHGQTYPVNRAGLKTFH